MTLRGWICTLRERDLEGVVSRRPLRQNIDDTHRNEGYGADGRAMRDPKLRHKDGLMLFDRVIANPPFSLDGWGQENGENDPYGRLRFGFRRRKGDFAFV